jgi:hypothetical protein
VSCGRAAAPDGSTRGSGVDAIVFRTDVATRTKVHLAPDPNLP